MASTLVSPSSGRCARAWRACSKAATASRNAARSPGPGPGLLAVGHGLVPHLAPQGMVRQAFDLLGHPVPGERLQGLDDAGMQHPPPLLQEAAVGHLVRQGVLEGVFVLGEQARLVEELGRLQVRQAAVQRRLGQLGNGLQQRRRAPPCR